VAHIDHDCSALPTATAIYLTGGKQISVIRHSIGDCTDVGRTCACERGLTLIKRIRVRERNLIAMIDGSHHWSLVSFASFREVAPVAQYQLSQYDIKNIELRLVTERPMTAEEETSLSTVIQEAPGHPFRLDFHYFEDQIQCSASGKFEEIASMMKESPLAPAIFCVL
jgi:phenylacetate-CoA ligase